MNRKIERLFGAFAILTFVIAWVVGLNLAAVDITPALHAAVPAAHHFTPVNGGYLILGDETENVRIGYARQATANGYGGPLKVVVAADFEGNILGISVVEHKETPLWFQKILNSPYLRAFAGKSYRDNFQLGQDVDGITGATYTTRAIAEAVLIGSRQIASTDLALEIPTVAPRPIRFGLPEITLIGLYALGYFGHKSRFKYTNQARWASMLIGLVVLGFIYTSPLTLADINKFLLGFWPEWQTHLYWYLLLGGMLFVFTIDNKNPYCEWFCPFGAAQECMGLIGGAKPRPMGQYKPFLTWLQRGLTWAAILLALLFRNPGLTSYEIFGVLFDLSGTTVQFALLALVLLTSLFVRRPWCNYLCPIRPVTDLFRTFRGWLLELWKKLLLKSPTSPK